MNAIIRHDDESKFDKLIDLTAENIPALATQPAPGIYEGISNEAYHGGPGVSKSGLWTIYKQTPAHFKFPKVKKITPQAQAIKEVGTATHTAVLEPHLFEESVIRGPEDRRGNKWKDLVNAPDNAGKIILPEEAYDEVLRIRDMVHSNNFINQILTSGDGINEATGYAIDPVTGELRRVRPDRYRRDIGLIIDVKTTESANPLDFKRSVSKYGYHAQEAYYSDTWADLGETVNGFLFIALEKDGPCAVSVFELPPSIVDEGRAAMRKALDTYHECTETGVWPGYAEGVQELKFDRWDYRETEYPQDEAA